MSLLNKTTKFEQVPEWFLDEIREIYFYEEDGIDISDEDLRAVTEYIIETFSFDLLKGNVEVDYVDIEQSDLIDYVCYFFNEKK